MCVVRRWGRTCDGGTAVTCSCQQDGWRHRTLRVSGQPLTWDRPPCKSYAQTFCAPPQLSGSRWAASISLPVCSLVQWGCRPHRPQHTGLVWESSRVRHAQKHLASTVCAWSRLACCMTRTLFQAPSRQMCFGGGLASSLRQSSASYPWGAGRSGAGSSRPLFMRMSRQDRHVEFGAVPAVC